MPGLFALTTLEISANWARSPKQFSPGLGLVKSYLFPIFVKLLADRVREAVATG